MYQDITTTTILEMISQFKEYIFLRKNYYFLNQESCNLTD